MPAKVSFGEHHFQASGVSPVTMIGEKKRMLRARTKIYVNNINTIEEVKKNLREDRETIFSTTEESYIEHKYIKYCLLKIREFAQKQLSFETLTSIRRFLTIFVNLKHISDLDQLGFSSCPHFELLRENVLSAEGIYKANVLHKLQQLVIPDILVFGDVHFSNNDDTTSSTFTRLLLKYLTDFKTQFLEPFHPMDLFSDTFQEHFDHDWQVYTRPQRNFGNELTRRHASSYSDLCEEMKRLTEIERKMVPNWCQLIQDTLTGSELRVEKRGERKILLINMPIIVLSKCLPTVQNYFATDSKISEVHFIAKYIFYINASLHQNIWHGKTILVLARKIHCLTDGLTWNVSGSIGKDFSEIKPVFPIKKGYSGVNGENGGPGESGGNITFIVKEYINPNYLSIYTNGGAGGNGQRGGYGQHGVMGTDGDWIKFEDLKENFESPITLFGNKSEVIIGTVKKLRNWSSNIVAENFVGFNEMGEKTDKNAFPERSIFMAGELTNGGSFEFCFNQWSVGRGVYLLFNGAKGTFGGSGGDGGFGGYGGEGGFPGNVVCLNFIGERMDENFQIYASRGSLGNDGENGKDGENGRNGEDGLDVGYVHIYNKSIKYYPPGKYKVVSCSQTDTSVECKHHNSHRAIQTHNPEKVPPQTSKKVKRERNNRANAQKQTPIDLEHAFKQLSSLNLSTFRTENRELLRTTRSEWNEIREIAEHTVRSITQNRDTSEAIRVTYTIPDGHITSMNDISSYSSAQKPGMNLDTFMKNVRNHPSFVSLQNSFVYHEQYIIEQAFGTEHNSLTRSFNITDTSKWTIPPEKNAVIKELFHKCLTTAVCNYNCCPLEEEILILNKLEMSNDVEGPNFSHDEQWSEVISDYIRLLWRNIFKVTKSVIELVAELYQKKIQFYERESITLNDMFAKHNRKLKPKQDCYHIMVLDEITFCRIVPNRDWRKQANCISSLLGEYRKPEFSNLVKYAALKQNFIDQLANNINVHPACVSVLIDSWPRELFMMFWDLNFTNCEEINWPALYNVTTEIADSRWNHTSMFPSLAIMSMLEHSSWSKELCFLLIMKVSPVNLPVYLLANFRYILDKIPSTIIDRLYPVCLTGLKTCREDVLLIFFTFFQNVAELSTLNHNEFLALLDNVASTTQILHQIDEINIRILLKELDKRISWIDSETRFAEALYDFHGIIEKYGKIKANMFLSILLDTPAERIDTSISDLFQNIHHGRFKISDMNLEILKNSERLSDFVTQIESQKEDIKEQDLEALVTFVLLDPETDNLLKEDLKNWWEMNKFASFCTLRSTQVGKHHEANQETVIKNQGDWILEIQSKVKNGFKQELLAEVLHRVDLVINKHFNHKLRCTQHFAVIIAILSKQKMLAEISTGEGKSYIVLALAIIKGLCGIHTDIITSSKVLAQRDANNFHKIYQEFGLSVGHITMENSMERTTNYNKTVVYGEVSQFQSDFLQDRFYNQNVRGSRPYESIIIDEVDSMFLDKGNNVLYMSHSPSNLDEVESILVHIWVQTLQMLNSDEYEPLQLHNNILNSLFPMSTKDLIQKRLDELQIKGITVKSIWEILKANKIINKHDKIDASQLGRMLSKKIKISGDEILDLNISYILLEQTQRKMDTLRCPDHLKEFVKLHLFTWIKNAYKATELQDGAEYILNTDYLSPTEDKSPSILLLDLDTGTDLKNSQWGEGLHQFLQLKHGCRLTTLSLKSVFISNISFFKKYASIFGLSGTLGTTQDKYFLTNTYQVNFLTVPTFLPKNFIEEPAIVSTDIDDWKEALFHDASQKLKERSVLILCETIQMAEEIAKFMEKKILSRSGIHLYRRDFEPLTVALNKSGLQAGELIIATNLAGRGTDIKISKNLKASGGLHVIFSYLPNNNRVKLQGFGRASRCGDPGSGRLIFLSDFMDNDGTTLSAIEHMNHQNDMEICRVNQIIIHYENVVCMEEKSFAEFELIYQEVCQCLSHASATFIDYFKKENDGTGNDNANQTQVGLKEINDIIRQNLVDDWVFWMDKYSTRLQELSQQNFSRDLISRDKRLQRIAEDYDRFTKKYNDVVTEYNSESFIVKIKTLVGLDYPFLERKSLSLIRTPALLVKLSKYYIKIRQWKEAVNQLNKVVDCRDDHTISTLAAKYYKLFCNLHNTDISNSDQAEEANNVIFSIKDQICFQNYLIRSILNCQSIPESTSSILHNTGGFQKQKEATIELLLSYEKSLKKLFGAKKIVANDFVDILPGNPLLRTLFFEELVSAKILSKNDHKYSSYHDELVHKLEIKRNEDFWQKIQSSIRTSQKFAIIDNSGYEESFHKDFKIKSENELEAWTNENIKSQLDCVLTTASSTLLNFNGSILMGTEEYFESYPEFLYFRRIGKAQLETFFVVRADKLKNLKIGSILKKENFLELPFITKTLAKKLFAECKERHLVDSAGFLLDQNFHSKIKENFMFAPNHLKRKVCELFEKIFAYELERLGIIKSLEQSKPTNPGNYLDKIVYSKLSNNQFGVNNANSSDKDKLTQSFALDREQFIKILTSPDCLSILLPNMVLNQKSLKLLYPKSSDNFLEKVYQHARRLQWVDKEGNISLVESSLENVYVMDDKDLVVLHEIKTYLQLRRLYTNKKFRKQITERIVELGPNILCDNNLLAYLTTLTPEVMPSLGSSRFLQREYIRLISYGLHDIISLKERPCEILFACAFGIGLLKVVASISLIFISAGTHVPISFLLAREGIYDMYSSFKRYEEGTLEWKDIVIHTGTQIVSLATGAFSSSLVDILVEGSRIVLLEFFKLDWFKKVLELIENYSSILLTTLSDFIMISIQTKITDNIQYTNMLRELAKNFDDKESKAIFIDASDIAASNAFCLAKIQKYSSYIKSGANIGLNSLLEQFPKIKVITIATINLTSIIEVVVNGILHAAETTIFVKFIQTRVQAFLEETEAIITQKLKDKQIQNKATLEETSERLHYFLDETKMIITDRLDQVLKMQIQQPILEKGVENVIMRASEHIIKTSFSKAKFVNKWDKHSRFRQSKYDKHSRQSKYSNKLRRAEEDIEKNMTYILH